MISYLLFGASISFTLHYIDHSAGNNLILSDLIGAIFCVICWPVVLIGIICVIYSNHSKDILIKGKTKQ